MAAASLKGQKFNAWIIIGVGIVHTLAHLILTQPRQAMLPMLQKGMFNVLGADWAAANFSVSMSLTLGFAIILLGIFILQMARNGLKLPFAAALGLTLLFLFIVYAGPTGGGWLALPSCVYFLVKSWPTKPKVQE